MQNEIQKDEKNVVEAGFTLVELLIVIVIMGILAGIVVFAVGNLTGTAKSNSCATEKSTIDTALEAYKAQNGSYPANMAALVPNYLKTTPSGYTINSSGVISPVTGPPAGGPNGCT